MHSIGRLEREIANLRRDNISLFQRVRAGGGNFDEESGELESKYSAYAMEANPFSELRQVSWKVVGGSL